MQISEVAEKFGLTTDTLRYYEREGLIGPISKGKNGIRNYDENDMPDFDELIKNFKTVSKLIKEKKIISAATIGVGGVAAAVSKMAFGNDIGAEINDDDLTYEYSEYSNQYYSNNKCPNCGYSINYEFEYCPKCGTKIK